MALSNYEVGAMYVLFVDRAAEKEGYDYWLGHSDLLSSCTEFYGYAGLWRGNIIPEINDHNFNRLWVENIYDYAFNKTYRADSVGIDYWTQKLDNGESRPSIIKQMIDLVPTLDQTLPEVIFFNNKIEIAEFATHYFDTVPDCFPLRYGRFEGSATLRVDSTPESVERAKDKIRLASKGTNPCYPSVSNTGGSSSGGGGSSSGGGGGSTCSSWG